MKIGIGNWARPFASVWRVVVFTLVVCATGQAWAAVPTVVWDGDFGTTEKTGSDGVTYTFAAGTGNSVVDGKLVIGSGSGYGGAITWSMDATKGVVSVLIKYSSLDTTDKGTPALAAVASMQCNNDGTPKGTIIDDCVCVKDANGTKLTGRYNNSSTAYGGEVADIKSPSGYLLMVYKSGASFQFWTSDDGLNWSGGTASDLKFSNTFPQGLGLGGMSGSASASGHGRTAGMTIEAVAIYRGVELNAAKTRNCHFDSEYTTQAYKKWAYANSVVSYNSASNSDIGSSGTKVKDFNIASGSNRGSDYSCGGDTSYFGSVFWYPFCCNQSAYSAPGCVLRVATKYTIGAGFSYSQGPLTLGGLIIESSADGCAFGGDAQSTVLGSAKDSCETWFSIKGNAAINRNGFMFISGNVNIDVAEGKSFSLNASQSTADYYPTIKGSVTTANTATGAGTDGGVLRMHGLGTITVPTLIASNSATLDFSDVQGNETVDRSETPFIQGNLTVDATTKLVLPAGIADGEEYKICSGTLTAPAKTVQTSVQVGSGNAFTAYVTYNASSKTVSYSTAAPTYTGTVDGSTITWDVTPTTEDIANGNIVLTGSGEVTLDTEPISITAASGVTVDVSGYEAAVLSGAGRFKFSSAYRTQIPSGMTYQYIGSNDSNNRTTYLSAITVNGTLETSGYLDLSGANKIATTGELHVLGGKTTMTTGSNDQGICGTLTIDPGATFVNGTTDGLHHEGSPTINVYGTLDMASTRWTLGGARLNFYAGSTITGNGQGSYGALDTNNSSKPFNILAKDGQGTVNLSARLRPRAQQTFNIADGVTVNCTSTVGDRYEQINITGSGTFKIATGANFPNNVPFNIASSATLELAGGTIAGAIQGTGNLSVASGTCEPSFSSFSGAVSVSGSGTVLTLTPTQVTAVSGITVGSGSTLKIKVTEAEILHGYDASSKVSNGGGTVMFVDSSGTQITENVSGDGETLNPSAKIWRDGTWAEPVASGDNAKLYISQNSKLTVSEALSLGTVTVVKEGDGNVELTISVSGAGALTTGGWTIPAGVTVVTADGMEISGDVTGGGIINIPANTTLTMDGVTTSGDTLADRVKVTVSGTLKTKGTTTLSAANTSAAGSLIEVVDGATTLSSAFKGLSGNITIDSGAVLSWAESIGSNSEDDWVYDHINPDGATVLDIAGTLHQNYRMTEFGANNKVLLRAGALVDGSIGDTGDTTYYAYGHWTWLDSGLGLRAYGNAELSIYIRTPENVAPEFTVDENAVLTISQAFIPQTGRENGAGSIVKAGAGTLDLTAITPTKPITINAGTVVVSTDPANANFANMTINQNGTFTLKDVAWTGAPSRFSGSGTLELRSESASCTHTVTGVTFPGIVKLSNVNMHPASGSPYYQNNLNPDSADMFAENIRPEFILDSDLTHLGNGYYSNNAEHPLRIKNLSGSGEFRGQQGSSEYKYVVETLQERNTTYDGTLGCDASGSNPRCVSLSVIGSTQSEIHSLTITRPINENADIGCQASTLKVSDYAKVVFTSDGGWSHGKVWIRENGWLESSNSTASAVTQLTLADNSHIVFPTSSSSLAGITSLTFVEGATTYISFPNGAPDSGTIIDWTAVGSAPAGTFVLEGAAAETHILTKGVTGLAIAKAYGSVTTTSGTTPYASSTVLFSRAAAAALAKTLQYITIFSNDEISVPVYADAILIKNVGNATINIDVTAEFSVTDSTGLDGITTYTIANAATEYTWTDAYNSLGSWNATLGDYETTPNHEWGKPRNWSFDSGTIATRYPQAGDTVIINDHAGIVLSENAACARMELTGAGVVSADSVMTLTVSGDVVLSTVATTLELTKVTLSANSVTTDVEGKVVKWVVDGNTTTYTVVDPVAQIGDVKYGSLANAIDVAGDGNLASIIIIDENAETPAGYHISNGTVIKHAIAIVDTKGVRHYYADAQLAIDAIASYLWGETVCDYYELDVGTGVDLVLGSTFAGFKFKLKRINGATANISTYTAEYSAEIESTEDGVETYSLVPVAGTYTWSPSSGNQWNRYSNWQCNGDTAKRTPEAGDNVVFGASSTVSVTRSITVASITNSSTVALSGSAAVVTATAGGIVLTDSAATLSVTGVTLSPLPTTSVEGKGVTWSTVDGTTTYSVADSVAMIGDNGYGSLALAIAAASDNDTITLSANCSESVDLGGKSITFNEGSYTFSGSFTGNGTLVLTALLKSADSARWAAGWTGTVVLPASLTLNGFNFDNYGRTGSTVQLQGANSGWLQYRSNNDPIATTIEIPDGARLTITGWSPSFANGFNVIKGAGTFAVAIGSEISLTDSSYTAYFLLKDVSKFTGSLSATGAGIAIGDTRIANSVVGGKIIVSSGKAATVGASSTWTAGTIEVNGNVSVASGGALSGTIAGSGEISLAALVNSAMSLGNWTGTVELPKVNGTVGGFRFDYYGKTGSTVKISKGFTGWLYASTADAYQVKARILVTGCTFTISGSNNDKWYQIAKLSGDGNFSFVQSNQPLGFHIGVVENFTGTISNSDDNGATPTVLTVTRLNVNSDPTVAKEMKILDTTTADKITVQNVYYNNEPVTISGSLSKVNKADGIYLVRAGTIFSVW